MTVLALIFAAALANPTPSPGAMQGHAMQGHAMHGTMKGHAMKGHHMMKGDHMKPAATPTP